MLTHFLTWWTSLMIEQKGFVVTVVGVVLTGLALIVVLIQLRVMERQTRLMGRQTRLMERQLEIVEEQDELLARRAELEMIITLAGRTQDNSIAYRFEVRNQGQKSARDFYWKLWLPVSIAEWSDITGRPDQTYDPRGDRLIDEVLYREYGDLVTVPVYPGRAVPIVVVDTKREDLNGSPEARWQVTSEDGLFPRQGQGAEAFGKIPLTPPE